MERLRDYFKKVYAGDIRGDCCSHDVYEAIKPVTVQELCDYIVSNDRTWGCIGIACPGTIFGKPNVEYNYGKYSEANFKFPPKIASAIVKRIDWDGGWSNENWVLTI